MLLWPYTLLRPIQAPYITFCLATELTNIGQNAFVLAGRGKLAAAAEVPVGVAWMLSFFIIRVVPVPALAYWMLDTHFLSALDCGLGGWWWVSVATLPIPLLLNVFWFYKMARHTYRRRDAEAGIVG